MSEIFPIELILGHLKKSLRLLENVRSIKEINLPLWNSRKKKMPRMLLINMMVINWMGCDCKLLGVIELRKKWMIRKKRLLKKNLKKKLTK
jgi:hypothetical protein